jgi:NAD+ kinase
VKPERLTFVDSGTEEARAARAELVARYGEAPPAEAEIIVALGGDGLMLQTLHAFLDTGKPVYGMNRGSVGFLMNDFAVDGLAERLEAARPAEIRPLAMQAVDNAGRTHDAVAFNEVSLLRQTHQAARLQVSIDGRVRMDELICDGVLIATPAGSTAYNLSAHGPILPLGASLLALTPISPFRPRRWRGALLPKHVTVGIEILEPLYRPVSASADHIEVRSAVRVTAREHPTAVARLLFDPDRSWEERILAEQFLY